MRQLQHCCISNVWNCCVYAGNGVQRDATTPNIVASAMFGIVVSMLVMVCKGMRQLQHCCISNVWNCCVHAGNGVQRDATTPTLLHQQCLESLCPCWQWCAKGCNNSQQYLDLQCIVGRIQPIRLSNNKMLGVVGSTTGSFSPTMLCPFVWGFIFSHNVSTLTSLRSMAVLVGHAR